MKVDVAVQSYKKPESLLYALMSLKKRSGQHIHRIFINDDSGMSYEELSRIYLSRQVLDYFTPVPIFLRTNTRRAGYWWVFVRGYRPKGVSALRICTEMGKSLLKRRTVFVAREDIRYQWAFDNAETDYLYVMHDDMIFHDDVLGLYIDSARERNADIVGDLGQCWRCSYKERCNPQKLMEGIFPSETFPVGTLDKAHGLNHLACRVNEWSALVKVRTELSILAEDRVFFGNYEDCGDVSGYWFSRLVRRGGTFVDPLPSSEERARFYTHGWFGRSGHSVWADQGNGKSVYQAEAIKERMRADFGVCLI